MEFFDFLSMLTAVLALLVAFPWVLFTGIAKVKAAKAAGEGTELRASELRRMIEASVEEATAPLVRRIETLEAIATDDEIPAVGSRTGGAGRLDPATLADVFDADLGDADEAAAVRRRARE